MAPQAAPVSPPQSAPTTEQPQPQAPNGFDPVKWLEEALEKAGSHKSRGRIDLDANGVQFADFEGVQRYARLLVAAGCVPTIKDDTPDQQFARATMCILLGRRVGLAPEQAVTSIYVVNCRPVIFGDAPLAICRQHSAWDESGFEEWFEVDGKRIDGEPEPEAFKKDSTCCVVQTLRKGARKPMVSRFSIGMAKAAGLFGRNASLYGGYPQRMLKFRARGYCLRDNFGDGLKGIGVRELIDQDEHQIPDTATALPVGRFDLATPTNGNGTHGAAPTVPAVNEQQAEAPPPPKSAAEDKPAPKQAEPEAQKDAPAPKQAPKAKTGDKRQQLRTLKYQIEQYKITPGALASALIELGLRGEEETEPVDLDKLSEDDCTRLVDELARPKDGTLFKGGKAAAQDDRR